MIKPNYYGQRGDDFLLWLPFLERETKGYFVEVGALDGKRFSNTYSFEEQGWTGICVEAHPDYIDIIKRNRPNSQVIFAAVGDETGTVTFYANSRGSLSTLDPTLEDRYKKGYGVYFTGFEERQVPMLTLAQILAESNAPQKIDVLSIDVEGAEMRVLKGMDWEQYQVRLVIIEADGDDVEQQLDSFFTGINYHKARKHFGNIIYCCDEGDFQLIAQTPVNGTIIHTPHPLDTEEPIRHIQVVDSQLILPDTEDTTMESNKDFQWLQKTRYYGKRLLQRVRSVLPHKPQTVLERTLSPVLDLGFHGDKYLLDLIEHLMAEAQNFIETGTNVGTTAHYVASHYPQVQVYSCEPDKRAFAKAQETTANDVNAHLYNQLSPQFLYQLHRERPELLKTLNLYWLDAHDYGFVWPLHDEIRYITETLPYALILVDDTQVPGYESMFRYCIYEDQECNYDYITNALAPGKTYRIFYPAYTEQTSKHHPLVGTMGILHGDVTLDERIFEHFTVVEFTRS